MTGYEDGATKWPELGGDGMGVDIVREAIGQHRDRNNLAKVLPIALGFLPSTVKNILSFRKSSANSKANILLNIKNAPIGIE